MAEVKTIRMSRSPDLYPAPHAADVHPDEVGEYAKGGFIADEVGIISGDGPIEIPPDWQTLHWSQRVKVAKALKADVAKADEADVVIQAEVDRRAAEAAVQ